MDTQNIFIDAPATSDIIQTTAPVVENTNIKAAQPRMFKTTKGNNINIWAIAEAAREDIQSVQYINIPSLVHKYRIRNTEYEAPTLSESGGGRVGVCQVVAGKDGRPVNVANVNYINSDPMRFGVRHATVSVGIGNYLALGWTVNSDQVILIYEIVGMQEYLNHTSTAQIAQLTLRLVAHELSSWRHSSISVPEFLSALMGATRNRLRSDACFPFYVDMFRSIACPNNEVKNFVNDILAENESAQYHEVHSEYLTQLMQEIIDIRYYQYAKLEPGIKNRRVDPLYLVETLTLDPEGNYIDISITPIRSDVKSLVINIRLTPQNFIDENGAAIIERGLVLDCTSFDLLRLNLEDRPERTVVTYLLSMR